MLPDTASDPASTNEVWAQLQTMRKDSRLGDRIKARRAARAAEPSAQDRPAPVRPEAPRLG